MKNRDYWRRRFEITQEQFDSMGYSERLKVFNETPELFKQFTGGTK